MPAKTQGDRAADEQRDGDVPVQTSVALCTFNGASFLRQQIDSICAQTVLPDEIVLVDDQSTDATWSLAERLSQRCPLPLRLHRNEQRLGYVRNFEHAVSLTRGSLVFLCDQDDVWLPHRVERCLGCFDDPQVLLVHSDASLVDADLRPLGPTLFEALKVSRKERDAVDVGDALAVLLRRNIVTGAAVAVRRSLLAAAAPFEPLYVHDEWLAVHAAVLGRIARIEEPLLLYRQHPGNQIGMPSQMNRLRHLLAGRALSRHAQALRLAALQRRLALLPLDADRRARALAAVSEAHHLAVERSALPQARWLRLPRVVQLLLTGRYGRTARGMHTAVRDLLEPDWPNADHRSSKREPA